MRGGNGAAFVQEGQVRGLLKGARDLTAQPALQADYSYGEHREAYFI